MKNKEVEMRLLLDKIKKIEALIEGATSEGEKRAAELAKKRVNQKMEDQPNMVEYRLYTPDYWHKKLLLAICRKYGLKPFRYHRQKYTTVMVKIEEDFLNNVVWKEYLEYSDHLEKLIEDITSDLINKIHEHHDEDIVQKMIG